MTKEIIPIDYEIIRTIVTSGRKDRFIEEGRTLTKKMCLEIIEIIKHKKNWQSLEFTIIMISGLAQKGGSNLNSMSSLVYEFDNNRLSANELLIVIRNKYNSTVRQFCKMIADEIAETALIMGVEGDLATQMKLTYPDVSLEEAVWCSSFQTRNPKCPKRTRDWLVDNYQKRFRN